MEDVNLSSIPYHSNQVVSPDVNNLDTKNNKDCCHVANSYTEQCSKLNEYRISDNTFNIQTSETSHNLTSQDCWKSCAVHGLDCNRITPLDSKFNNDTSDSIKEPVLSTSETSNSTAETPVITGRTRIGISSLNHQQKNGLHLQEKLHFMDIGSSSYKYQYNLSSDSGVSSPSNGTLNKMEKCSICSSHLHNEGTINNNSSCHFSSFSDFSEDELHYIPPPPGYENSPESITKSIDEKTEIQIKNDIDHSDILKVIPKHNAECHNSSSTSSVLDLQQLRKKSQDLGLPLLSALCNDRSLLMLPKTVPSCTRDRHLGINSNKRRFSCSAVNPSYISEMCNSDEILGVRERSHTTPQLRPISWHIDRDFPWQNSKVADIQNIPPLIENISINDNKEPMCLVTSSILTSFSNVQTGSSTQYINSNPLRQMIPTKLSSAFGGASHSPSK
ncbi:uncharacterized protein [Centruroides vittatus]|uniref:uncharacterized protein n=1 Tax=Centruroides vittatus TaxID=120091 RepID=UPI0035106D48